MTGCIRCGPEQGPEPVRPELARGGLINVGPDGNLDLDNLFTYHPPHGDQVERFALIRAQGRELAKTIAELCPGSPERSAAISRVRESVMWANAAIACHEKPGTHSAPVEVTYVGTLHDRVTEDDDGNPVVIGLPYRAESDGLRAAATTPEGAQAMIESMRARRHPSPEQQP